MGGERDEQHETRAKSGAEEGLRVRAGLEKWWPRAHTPARRTGGVEPRGVQRGEGYAVRHRPLQEAKRPRGYFFSSSSHFELWEKRGARNPTTHAPVRRAAESSNTSTIWGGL